MLDSGLRMNEVATLTLDNLHVHEGYAIVDGKGGKQRSVPLGNCSKKMLLRHTFATMALQNGVDVKTVSSMLGHYSAGFTLDTYAHVTTDAQLKAVQTMGNILSRAV